MPIAGIQQVAAQMPPLFSITTSYNCKQEILSNENSNKTVKQLKTSELGMTKNGNSGWK